MFVCAWRRLRASEIGAGKHGNFLMAMNNFGEELYVQPEDEAAAREVIAKWRRERQEERENQKQNPETESSEKTNKMIVPRILAGILVVVVVALYLTHIR